MRLPTPLAPALIAVVAALAGGCGSDGSDDGANPAVDRLTVAAAGDFGIERESIATLGAIGKVRPGLVLGLGDFSYAGPRSEREFCRLVRSEVGDDVPVEVLAGNHEDDAGEDGFIDEFAACLPDRLDAQGSYGRQYYFDVGSLARFIMISPDLTIDGELYRYGDGDPRLAWLRETIEQARSAGIEWVIVGMHKSCISAGLYDCEAGQDLFGALVDAGVDLVVSAHDHTYQRSKQLAAGDGCEQVVAGRFDPECVADDDAAYRRGAGTAFVVSGAAGGAALYPIFSDDPDAKYFAASMGRTSRGARQGFALLTITPERLDVRFVGSTPGSFEDRFVIEGD